MSNSFKKKKYMTPSSVFFTLILVTVRVITFKIMYKFNNFVKKINKKTKKNLFLITKILFKYLKTKLNKKKLNVQRNRYICYQDPGIKLYSKLYTSLGTFFPIKVIFGIYLYFFIFFPC